MRNKLMVSLHIGWQRQALWRHCVGVGRGREVRTKSRVAFPAITQKCLHSAHPSAN